MKKNMALLLSVTALFLAVSGCFAPANLGKKNDAGIEQTTEADLNDVPDEVAKADSVSGQDPVTDENSGASDNTAAEPVEVTEDTGAAEAVSENAASGNDAGTAVSVNPDDIVEPELKQEEVQNPVEQAPAVSANTAEPKAEEDDAIDIVFIGDSQFDNARGTGSEIPAYTCASLKDLGKINYYNLAIGGTTASLSRDKGVDFASWDEANFLGICYALEGIVNTDFLNMYPAAEDLKYVKPENVDVYVIEYGANDYINGKDLFNPNYSYDTHTFGGALSVGLEELKKISPKAKIVLCGPSYCMWYDGKGFVIGDSYTISKGIATLSEYANTASNLADSAGIEYMDTMYASLFDLKITTVDDYLSDGLHYTEKGRQIYATVLSNKIRKVLGLEYEELPYIEINSFEYKWK